MNFMFYTELQDRIMARLRERGCSKESLELDLRAMLHNFVWSQPHQRYVDNWCYYFVDSKLSFKLEELNTSTSGPFPHPLREYGKVYFSLQLLCNGSGETLTHPPHHVWIRVAGEVVEVDLAEETPDQVAQGKFFKVPVESEG